MNPLWNLEAADKAVSIEKMRSEIAIDIAVEKSQLSREEIEGLIRNSLGEMPSKYWLLNQTLR